MEKGPPNCNAANKKEEDSVAAGGGEEERPRLMEERRRETAGVSIKKNRKISLRREQSLLYNKRTKKTRTARFFRMSFPKDLP